MDPITIATIIGAVAPLVANAIGDAIASGDTAKARKLADEAAIQYKDVLPPQLKEQVAKQQSESSLVNASRSLDPAGRNAQMTALERLGQTADTGWDAQSTADFQRAKAQAGSMDAGFRGAAAQHAAQTGIGGQSAYVSALLGGQQAANVGNQMGVQASADASARRMKAIDSMGILGGQMRQQDWGQARDVGQATDDINHFNTSLASRADRYNLGLGQQNYENQRQHAGDMQSSLYNQQANYEGRARDTRQTAATYGAAAGSAANGVAGGMKGGQDAAYEEWKRKQEGYNP